MTGNELMTDNEEYIIRQQFLETFGGTTFKHLIEWFKSQKQGGRINILDFNLYPIIRSVKGYNNFISDAGYYLHFNKYRANLLIYENERKSKPKYESMRNHILKTTLDQKEGKYFYLSDFQLKKQYEIIN